MTRTPLVSALLLATGLQAAETVEGLNRFSANLYSELAKSGGGNLIVSPFSISGAVSMALAGARGQTAAEMARVLGQSPSDPRFHSELAARIAEIAKATNIGDNHFLSANSLWLQQDFKILPGFRDTLQNTYNAPPSSVDFARNLEAAREAINAWTENQTHGKIRGLFAPGALTPDTRLVLASAVYFYGKWERPFRRADTHIAPFTPYSGPVRQTDFMNQTGRFDYADIPSGQLLEMPYAGTGLAFDILLPRKGAPLDALDDAMNADRLKGWLASMKDCNVEADIPKFRLDSEFSLAPVLAKLGMRLAFSNAADFSGIDDRRDLRLSQVVHKAYIDVAEQGTEAAAATGIGIALIAAVAPPQDVKLFRADHPFLFLIRDTRTGLILFTGRVMNPKG